MFLVFVQAHKGTSFNNISKILLFLPLLIYLTLFSEQVRRKWLLPAFSRRALRSERSRKKDISLKYPFFISFSSRTDVALYIMIVGESSALLYDNVWQCVLYVKLWNWCCWFFSAPLVILLSPFVYFPMSVVGDDPDVNLFLLFGNNTVDTNRNVAPKLHISSIPFFYINVRTNLLSNCYYCCICTKIQANRASLRTVVTQQLD